ncbi:MAG: class I SAM-dependent methyltransferase, partial [Gammaproteobacteria bacterium]
MKSLVKRLQQPYANPFKQFKHVVGYDETVRQLAAEARGRGEARLVLVMDHHVAVSAEGVDLALRAARDRRADLVCCTQLEGLLPVVVSVVFLERWLQRDGAPDPRWLWSPTLLSEFGVVADLQLVNPDRFPGRIRCGPVDERETSVCRFWGERASELGAALAANPDAGGAGREHLEILMGEYRSQLVAGLETYEVVGSLSGVDDVRRRMVTTEKPLVDYFVVAMHLGRFLQRYAGLRPASRVVDIGCSWGYFGFALANFLGSDGAYVGVEVQKSAVDWARQRLGWLGKNFQFEHLDIYNAFYNPTGTVPRDKVRLPISDGWADVILAGSVFTHMAEDGVQSYLSEFRRILRPGGIAAFSYDDKSFFGGDGEAIVVDKHVPD